MTGTRRMFFIGMLVCLLGACASPKDVVYLQDAKVNSRVKAALQYRTVIHVDDLLSIVVSCDDIEAALPFNTPMIGLGQNNTRSGNEQLRLLGGHGRDDRFPGAGQDQGGGAVPNGVGSQVKGRVERLFEKSDRDHPVLELQGNGTG